MAGTTTKVDTAKLRATAGAFTETQSQVKSSTNSMIQTIQQLTGTVWSGNEAQQFVGKFNALQNEMNRIDRMIAEHISDLNQMAADYDAAAAAAAGITSSLPSEAF